MSEQIEVRAGAIDILLAARSMRDISDYQFAQLVTLCAHTQAWCVREELDQTLLNVADHGVLSAEMMKGLLEAATKERTACALQLSAYATSLLSDITKH